MTPNQASAAIWAIVCGMARRKGAVQLLLMLEAYIDDSRQDQPPIFVLAGYLASVEYWAKFAERWQEILDMPPRLEYFKMKEVWGWSKDQKERLPLFYKAVEDTVFAEFSIMFPADAPRTVYGADNKMGSHPFYFAEIELTATLARNLKQLGLKEQRINFIFDEQMHEKVIAFDAWEWAKTNAQKPDPPNLLDVIGSLRFDNDKCTLPLQAADMHAWWMRRRYWERNAGTPRIEYPWTPTRPIPNLEIEYTETSMRAEKIRRELLREADSSRSGQ
jgi:uncharacterized protein DUF3800